MLLATIILLCSFSENQNVAKAIAERSAALASDSAAAPLQPLPSQPQPKVEAHAVLGRSSLSSIERSGGDAAPSAAPKPIKPGEDSPRETRTKRRVWYTLMLAGHGGAAFDAWSTRRAVSQGYGTEANPLLRPFANSGAMYAATQLSPLLMDLLGKRMITSRHRWVRRVWWLPQAAVMGMSIGAGVHNLELAH